MEKAPAKAIPVNAETFTKEYFKDIPVLVQIARCESGFRQFNTDGSVLQGEVDSRDTGIMQINKFYHLSTATKLGYNINTLEGNLAYARYLYEHQGTQPWLASRGCWAK